MPLLGVLSNLCGDTRPRIQEKSMDLLFSLLSEYGYAFSMEFWFMIFQGVLRPLFDEIQFTFQLKSHSKEIHWLRTSCQKAFGYITNLMYDYFDKLHDLVPQFFKT